MSKEEGNKLIAEFDGGVYDEYPDGHFPGEYGYKFGKDEWWNVNALQYDSSWDWLMPVVERVEKTNMISIWSRCCDVSAEGRIMTYPPMNQTVGGTKIEATYKAVVEFLEWYNSQEKLKP